jgi:hypothetical protein
MQIISRSHWRHPSIEWWKSTADAVHMHALAVRVPVASELIDGAFST